MSNLKELQVGQRFSVRLNSRLWFENIPVKSIRCENSNIVKNLLFKRSIGIYGTRESDYFFENISIFVVIEVNEDSLRIKSLNRLSIKKYLINTVTKHITVINPNFSSNMLMKFRNNENLFVNILK